MSTEAKRRYIEQQALCAAQRAIDRRGRGHFNASAFRTTRIQTLEPGKRTLLLCVSVITGISGYFTLTPSIGGLSIALFVASALFLIAAALGVRKTVEAALNGVDPIQIITHLF